MGAHKLASVCNYEKIACLHDGCIVALQRGEGIFAAAGVPQLDHVVLGGRRDNAL